MSWSYGNPEDLLVVGGFSTVAGAVLIWRAITGDTLLSGTIWTHIPEWFLITAGILMQVPLIASIWVLRHQGFL